MQISQSDVVRVRRARWRIVDIRPYARCDLLTLVGAGPSNLGSVRRVLPPFDVVERLARREQPTRVSDPLVAACLSCACRRRHAARRPSVRLERPHGSPAAPARTGARARPRRWLSCAAGRRSRPRENRSGRPRGGGAGRAGRRRPRAHCDAGRACAISGRTSFKNASRSTRGGRRPQPSADGSIAAGRSAIPGRPFRSPSCRSTTSSGRTCLRMWRRAAGISIVIDEAHGVARDSDRHAAVAALTVRAPYVVLVTATPHSGDREAFRSLCALGAIADESLLIFRRTRRDVGLAVRRHVRRLFVRLNAAEASHARRLEGFAHAVRRANPANLGNPENRREPREPRCVPRPVGSPEASLVERTVAATLGRTPAGGPDDGRSAGSSAAAAPRRSDRAS